MDDRDLADMGHYDIMAEYGTPFFHWGGVEASRQLADLLGINSDSRVLMVGCGTGYITCYFAEEIGCQVVGIDISTRMVERANERREQMGLQDRTEFRVADAHNLPFEDNSFDIVMTEFVSIFLDKPKAFAEYSRVTKPGGAIGINELYKDDEIPEEALAIIQDAEDSFEESTGMPLSMPSSKTWVSWFEGAGLVDVQETKVEGRLTFGEYKTAIGGTSKLLGMTGRVLKGYATDSKLRKRMSKVGKTKDVLMRNKKTRDYCGAVIVVGRKPV